MREPYDEKVSYRTASGYESTAYLDEREGDVAWGANKHSDEPLTLRWNGTEWMEETHA